MIKKTLSRLIISALLTGAVGSALAGTVGPLAPVKEILQMGSNWQNGNRGGFLFRTQNMPTDIDYYIVRPQDVSLNQFLSQIELSLTNGRQMNVEYSKINTACTNPSPAPCNKFEGDVVSMWLY